MSLKMELMYLDFPTFLLSLIIASIFLVFYSIFAKISDLSFDIDKSFAVIDVVRTLKKACPVQSLNKWKLLPLTFIRCWSRSIPFPGFKDCVKLYGATCAVTCSSVYAFSLMSDISKWSEWEPSPSSQNLLRSSSGREFKTDCFLQASQITGIQGGTRIQSYVALYQFLSLPSKCTKWILLWNAKEFEFSFFLIQPATSRSIDVQCVITHLYSCNHLSSYSPSLVAQRLRNIQDFLFMSQLNVRPLGYPVPSAPEFLPVLEEKESVPPIYKEPSASDSKNSVFLLVPLFYGMKFGLKKLKGYNLDLKKMKEPPPAKKVKKQMDSPKRITSHEPLRRAHSDMSITVKDFQKNEFILNSQNTSKAPVINNLKKISSEVFLDDLEIIEECPATSELEENSRPSPPPRRKQRSLSDPAVEKTLVQLAENECDDRNLENLHSIQEVEESQEVTNEYLDKNELFCSSTSDFEVLDSNQQFIDTRKADFLTQGNYGASVLQTEMMLASQFDRTLHMGNRVAGGWIHCSTHKGIPVLSKSITGKVMKIISFLCQIEIPVNFKDVWKCVKNPRFRFMSDETVKTVQIIDRISESQRLIHVYHETSGILRKEAVDFCLLQTEREEKNNFYSVFQSIEYERCPLMTSVTRGTLKPSGWIVQNISPKSCKITYLVQVIVNNPDSIFIQDLSTLVPQSLYNLRQYTASKPTK